MCSIESITHLCLNWAKNQLIWIKWDNNLLNKHTQPPYQLSQPINERTQAHKPWTSSFIHNIAVSYQRGNNIAYKQMKQYTLKQIKIQKHMQFDPNMMLVEPLAWPIYYLLNKSELLTYQESKKKKKGSLLLALAMRVSTTNELKDLNPRNYETWLSLLTESLAQ